MLIETILVEPCSSVSSGRVDSRVTVTTQTSEDIQLHHTSEILFEFQYQLLLIFKMADFFKLEINFSSNSISNLTSSYIEDMTPHERGGLVVILDMGLAILSIIMNLVVISGIREREKMNMYHILLANLCISNLISAVLVTIEYFGL